MCDVILELSNLYKLFSLCKLKLVSFILKLTQCYNSTPVTHEVVVCTNIITSQTNYVIESTLYAHNAGVLDACQTVPIPTRPIASTRTIFLERFLFF